MIKVLDELEDEKHYENQTIKFEDYNFQELLKDANERGMNACTNNELGIEDQYYNTYLKDKMSDFKESRKDNNFSNEKEYEYLELFLQICKQLEIQPLIVNVPVNGRWYDYIGIEKEKRENYYNKILEISKKYNVQIADFSNCEYEKYFLKDVMHVGWRGWVKIDEAVYKYYCEK